MTSSNLVLFAASASTRFSWAFNMLAWVALLAGRNSEVGLGIADGSSAIFTSLNIPRLSMSSLLRSFRFTRTISPPVLCIFSAAPATIPRNVLSMPAHCEQSTTIFEHPRVMAVEKNSPTFRQLR